MVHTAPYVDLSITIVGGLSPKFHVTPLFVLPFFHKLYDTISDFYHHRHTMGVVGQGLYRHPWLEYALSGATRAFPPSWVTTAALGLL